MVVSGLLVNIYPEELEQVKKELHNIVGLKISDETDDRLVVILQSETDDDEIATSKKIAMMDGVISVKVAYHHFEKLSDGY
jgi:nitrate reductase NapAB chaperone NapD